jgi:hypothetical protein
MRTRRFVLGIIFFSIFIITTSAGNAAKAKCAAGEVWGDLGCRPAAEPSILVKAARRIKDNPVAPKAVNATRGEC